MKISWRDVTVVLVACLSVIAFGFAVSAKTAQPENVPATVVQPAVGFGARFAIGPGTLRNRGLFVSELYSSLDKPDANADLAVMQAQMDLRSAILNLRQNGRAELSRILTDRQMRHFDQITMSNGYYRGVRLELTDPTLTDTQRAQINGLSVRQVNQSIALRRQFLAQVMAIEASHAPLAPMQRSPNGSSSSPGP